MTTERRGRPAKKHCEGELRSCVECRQKQAESQEQAQVGTPELRACAEALVAEYFRRNQ